MAGHFETVLDYFAGRGDGRYTIIVRDGAVAEIMAISGKYGGEQAKLYESPHQMEERQRERNLHPKLPLPILIFDEPLSAEEQEHLLELEQEYGG